MSYLFVSGSKWGISAFQIKFRTGEDGSGFQVDEMNLGNNRGRQVYLGKVRSFVAWLGIVYKVSVRSLLVPLGQVVLSRPTCPPA